MNDWIEKIDKLDLSLFEAIPSETDSAERRSLLAVQRATARKHKRYVYLEIGSHLGGSIQPHLVDNRCKMIYSIDPRPPQQPDDRSPGYIAYYDNNSSERMLNMLGSIGYGDVAKIECFDLDASKVDQNKITSCPQIVFIDGEHTMSAVLSDFQFCSKVVCKNGTILFHDFWIIYPTILEICKQLDKQDHTYMILKLDGSVCAIFFDPNIVHTDPYLTLLHKKNKFFWLTIFIELVKKWLKQYLPPPLLKFVRGFWKALVQ